MATWENGWGDTRGEGLCMFWHGAMAASILPGSTATFEITSAFTYTWNEPLLTYELVHDINNGYTYHCTIATLLTELCHYVFLWDLTLYITDSWKYFRLIWRNQWNVLCSFPYLVNSPVRKPSHGSEQAFSTSGARVQVASTDMKMKWVNIADVYFGIERVESVRSERLWNSWIKVLKSIFYLYI